MAFDPVAYLNQAVAQGKTPTLLVRADSNSAFSSYAQSRLGQGVQPEIAIDLTTGGSGAYQFKVPGSTAAYDAQMYPINPTGVNGGGTLVLQGGIINLQGKLTPFYPIGQQYTGQFGDAGADAVAGYYRAVGTNSSGSGQGFRFDYLQSGSNGTFTVAHGVVANFAGMQRGQSFASWLVAQSPVGTTYSWAAFCAEYNPVNLGGDTGYTNARGTVARPTGALQLIPESSDFASPVPSLGSWPTVYGLCIGHSSAMSSQTSWYAQTYNGVLIEKDSIAPGGVGVELVGNVDRTTNLPNYAIRIEGRWNVGLDFSQGIYTNGWVATIGPSQSIVFLNSGGSVVGQLSSSLSQMLPIAKATALGLTPGNGSFVLLSDGASNRPVAFYVGGTWRYADGTAVT